MLGANSSALNPITPLGTAHQRLRARRGRDTARGARHHAPLYPQDTGCDRRRRRDRRQHPPGAAGAQGGGRSPPAGLQEGAIDIYGPGSYEYALTYTYADGHTAQATGKFTIYANASHVDTTPAYLTPSTPMAATPTTRWGNVLAVNDPRMTWAAPRPCRAFIYIS